LVDLPEGRYRIAARLDGWKTERRELTVGPTPRKLHIAMHRAMQ
jgi:hypothetical protein